MAIRKRYLILISALMLMAFVFVAVLVALVLTFALVEVTSAPLIETTRSDSLSTRIEKSEEWQEKLFKNREFNGAILVIKDGEVLVSNCCGYTDASKKVKLTPQTPMRLASVSKQFTAAGILVLAQQEKVGLDDLVTLHLKDFPFEDVTVKHLLNMTSGVPDCYMDLAEKYKNELGEFLTISDVPRLISKYPPSRENAVNVAHDYSNTSYVLLAAIVESASGSRFEEFMADELFGPLGMKNTRVWNLVSKNKSSGQAKTFIGSRDQVPTFLDGVAGDGAVFCCLEDFVIWNQFWRGNDLVSPELMKQALERPSLANDTLSDYGFGWRIESDCHWHSGLWLGANTLIYQDDDFFVVVLDNSGSLIVDSMGQELRRVFDE